MFWIWEPVLNAYAFFGYLVYAVLNFFIYIINEFVSIWTFLPDLRSTALCAFQVYYFQAYF